MNRFGVWSAARILGHGRGLARVCVFVGVCCAMAGCSRGTPSRSDSQRQHLWAELRSQEVRAAQLAELGAIDTSGAEALEMRRQDFLQRNGVQPAEIEALLREGKRERWEQLPMCEIPAGVVHMNALVLAPATLRPIVPEYTQAACDARVEGVAFLRVVVGPEGAREAEVVKGLPLGLDERAIHAARDARWLPALICGKPATVAYTVPVVFRLPPTCSS